MLFSGPLLKNYMDSGQSPSHFWDNLTGFWGLPNSGWFYISCSLKNVVQCQEVVT